MEFEDIDYLSLRETMEKTKNIPIKENELSILFEKIVVEIEDIQNDLASLRNWINSIDNDVNGYDL